MRTLNDDSADTLDYAMHWLLELHNVERLLSEAEQFSGGNGLVTGVGGFARSILKFGSISVCEAFGYLIASAIGVRVPRMQGVWMREAVSTDSIDAEPGRIVVLVEHHEAGPPYAERPKNQFGTVLEDPAIRWQRHSASTGGSRSLRRARLSLFLVEQRPTDRGALPTACETSRPESESDVGIGAVSSPALAGTPVA